MPRKPKLPPGMWERNGTYYARFRAHGRVIRKRLSTQLDAAKTMLNNLKARADLGDFGIIDNDYPWEALKAEFLRWASQSLRHHEQYRADLEDFERFQKVDSIRQITHEYVVGFREWRFDQGVRRRDKNGKVKRAGDVTPRTVNRQVGTLRNMLNRGVVWGRIGHNPVADVRPLPHDCPKKERRALTLEEVQALFDKTPEFLRPVWQMFMTTGIRKGELVNMRFADVDFDRRVVTVRATTAKNHRPREIPLDDGMVDTIAELKQQAPLRRPVKGGTARQTELQRRRLSKEHVFVTKANTPWTNNLLARFYACCKRAKIEDAHTGGAVDIHALRVSFTTLSMELGGKPRAIQAILGHSTLGLTMGVYARATEQGKREAVSVLPFANVTAPDHVIPMQNAHTVRTSSGTEAQSEEAQALA